jgi:ABC-2 type transport system ATP-binding protein
VDGGVRQLKGLLDRLEDEHVEIEGLSLHRPTLDDVFLALTGHEAATEVNESHHEAVGAGKDGGR